MNKADFVEMLKTSRRIVSAEWQEYIMDAPTDAIRQQRVSEFKSQYRSENYGEDRT